MEILFTIDGRQQGQSESKYMIEGIGSATVVEATQSILPIDLPVDVINKKLWLFK